MITSTVEYTGGLRTEAVHVLSGTRVLTDAPRDNHGKGEAFSPTDLVATALASCMLSIMGIVANREGAPSIDGTRAEVIKIMASDPRRISELRVRIIFPKNNYTEKDKTVYEHAARTCPVARSLHPDIVQQVEFIW